MAKTDFSWVNAVNTAAIAASSEAGSLPAANLADPRTGRIWRSLATTAWVTMTFPSATAVKVLALGGCGLAATDTVRHRLYDTDGMTVLYDSGVIACGVLEGYWLHPKLLPQVYTAKSWRCDIVATSRAALGYFDIKRAWAGPVLQPAKGISLPRDRIWDDTADVDRAKLSGGVYPGDGPTLRTENIQLNWLTEAEMEQLQDMQRIVGRRGQVLVIPNEAGNIAREAILGHFDKLQSARQVMTTIPPSYQQGFTIIQDP